MSREQLIKLTEENDTLREENDNLKKEIVRLMMKCDNLSDDYEKLKHDYEVGEDMIAMYESEAFRDETRGY